MVHVFFQSTYACSTRVEYEFLHPKSKRNKDTFNLTKSEFESAEMTFTYRREKKKTTGNDWEDDEMNHVIRKKIPAQITQTQSW